MKATQLNVLRSLRRVQEFITAHPLSDAPAALGKQSDELNSVVAQLSQDTLDQVAGGRFTESNTKHQHKLRVTLWKQHMQPVARIARELFDATGLDRALKMPSLSISHEAMVAAGRAMAEAAAKSETTFVEHGLPVDFVAQLRAAVNALDTALGDKDTSYRRKIQATAGVVVNLRRGKRAVRLLNAIIAPRLESDPELRAAWNNARKVRPVSQQAEPGVITAPTLVPSPASPAPAAINKAA
jgi:hypothetical protein